MSDSLFQFFDRRFANIVEWLADYEIIHIEKGINDFDWWDEDGEQYLFSRDQFEEFRTLRHSPLYQELK